MSIRHSRDLPGQDGMVILEYTGNNAGDMEWRGNSTYTKYILGGTRKRGYVDKKDAPGLLALKKNGQRLFAEVEPLEVAEVEIAFDAELLLKTVRSLEGGLPNLSEQQLETTLQAEKTGKNRTSAISIIEAQLERVA